MSKICRKRRLCILFNCYANDLIAKTKIYFINSWPSPLSFFLHRIECYVVCFLFFFLQKPLSYRATCFFKCKVLKNTQTNKKIVLHLLLHFFFIHIYFVRFKLTTSFCRHIYLYVKASLKSLKGMNEYCCGNEFNNGINYY